MPDGSLYLHEQLRGDCDIRRSTAGAGGYATYTELRHTPVLMASKLFTLTAKPRRKRMMMQECAEHGCKTLVKRGRCEEHKRVPASLYDAKRGTAHQRLYTKQWARYSQMRLQRYPLCANCEEQGKLTSATVTDHKIPHRGDVNLFWDPTNHQSLCTTCHNAKTRSGQ